MVQGKDWTMKLTVIRSKDVKRFHKIGAAGRICTFTILLTFDIIRVKKSPAANRLQPIISGCHTVLALTERTGEIL